MNRTIPAAGAPRRSPLDQILRAGGLRFADPADEEAFADRYARGTWKTSQSFIVVGAIAFCLFYRWGQIIDPVHSPHAIRIRMFFAAPLMLLCAASLYWQPMRRHVEWVVLAAYTTVQIAQIWVYSTLAKGFDYAAMGFVLIFLALTSSFAVRLPYLLLGAGVAIGAMIGGDLYAANARPGWLIINALSIITATGLGLTTSVFRELAARKQFLTDRALAASRARADELLESILPGEIIHRINAGEHGIVDSLDEVSIVYADLAGFTSLSRRLSPPDLVRLLDEMFSRFDRAAEAHGMEKIKTIGDAYFAVGGLRAERARDHAIDAADFALTIQAEVRRLIAETDYPINLRVGLHVGPVIAGVIGVSRPSFDCWGEAVTLASGLEARAEPGTILISEQARNRLDDRYTFGASRRIEIKRLGGTQVCQLIAPLAEA